MCSGVIYGRSKLDAIEFTQLASCAPRLERASLFIEKCQSLFPARLSDFCHHSVSDPLLRHEFYPIV